MNYLRDPKVLAVLVVVAFLVVVALRWDPANMWQNLAAEAAGISLGVLLTVTVVERMLERRHRERWEAVRSQVFRAISNGIVNILTDYMICLTADPNYFEGIGYRSKPTVEAADAMAAALEHMRKEHRRRLEPISGLDKGPPILELYKETEEDFSRLRDVLTPRLIEFGETPKLIRLLMDVEEQRTYWKDTMAVEEWGAPLEMVFDAAMDTLDALIGLYRYLAGG